jgi:hypothetical protein
MTNEKPKKRILFKVEENNEKIIIKPSMLKTTNNNDNKSKTLTKSREYSRTKSSESLKNY